MSIMKLFFRRFFTSIILLHACFVLLFLHHLHTYVFGGAYEHFVSYSNSGCSCVSLCGPSLMRNEFWCHVKPAGCQLSSSIPSSLRTTRPNHLNTLKEKNHLHVYNDNVEMNQVIQQENNKDTSNNYDISHDIQSIIKKYISLVSNVPRRLYEQSLFIPVQQQLKTLEHSERCNCKYDIVGIWDYCDPLHTTYSDTYGNRLHNTSSSLLSHFDKLPFESIGQKNELWLTALTMEQSINNSTLTDMTIPIQSRHHLNRQYLNTTHWITPKKAIIENNTIPSQSNDFSHYMNIRTSCHRTCKTCLQSFKPSPHECLSCPNFLLNHVDRFVFIRLFPLSFIHMNGRCVPITSSRDYCHISCKECRKDCCKNSLIGCLSCFSNSSLLLEHNTSFGKCIPHTTIFYNDSRPLSLKENYSTVMKKNLRHLPDLFHIPNQFVLINNSILPNSVFVGEDGSDPLPTTVIDDALQMIIPYESSLFDNNNVEINHNFINTSFIPDDRTSDIDNVKHRPLIRHFTSSTVGTRSPPNISTTEMYPSFYRSIDLNNAINSKMLNNPNRYQSEPLTHSMNDFFTQDYLFNTIDHHNDIIKGLENNTSYDFIQQSMYKCKQINLYLQQSFNHTDVNDGSIHHPQSIGYRYWNQLVFLHADNNIEASGLADLNEMLEPYTPDFLTSHSRKQQDNSFADYMHLVVLVDTRQDTSSFDDNTNNHHLQHDMIFSNQPQESVNYFQNLVDRLFSHGKSNKTSIPLLSTTDNTHYSTRYLKETMQLDNIVVCPELDITDSTTYDELKLNNGEAFELYRVPRFNSPFESKKKPYEWLLLSRRGEIDMNHPNILSDFITRSMLTFPALHYSLVMWNHGSAWAGFGDDEDSSDHRNMALSDIALGIHIGLKNANKKSQRFIKFSLLGFDACLMNELTVVETLSPFTDYFIASEDNEPGIGWDWRYLTPIIQETQDTRWTIKKTNIFRPSTPIEYAHRIVEGYSASTKYRFLNRNDELTISVIDTRHFILFKKQFHFLLKSLYACGGKGIGITIKELTARLPKIRGCDMIGLCSCIDFGIWLTALTEEVLNHPFDSYIINQVFSVRAAYKRMIVIDISDYRHESPQSRKIFEEPFNKKNILKYSHALTRSGMSIFFPLSAASCPADIRAGKREHEYTKLFSSPWANFVKKIYWNTPGSMCTTTNGKNISSLSSSSMIDNSSVMNPLYDSTELLMLQSKKLQFRLFNFNLTQTNQQYHAFQKDISPIQFSGSVPKTAIGTQAFGGIVFENSAILNKIIRTEKSLSSVQNAYTPDEFKPTILLTTRIRMIFSNTQYVSNPYHTIDNIYRTGSTEMKGEWIPQYFYIQQKRNDNVYDTSSSDLNMQLITSPIFVVSKGSDDTADLLDIIKTSHLQSNRTITSQFQEFLSPMKFYPTRLAVEKEEFYFAHLSFTWNPFVSAQFQTSPLLFVSKPDGLVRWKKIDGGYIRPVLRIVKTRYPLPIHQQLESHKQHTNDTDGRTHWLFSYLWGQQHKEQSTHDDTRHTAYKIIDSADTALLFSWSIHTEPMIIFIETNPQYLFPLLYPKNNKQQSNHFPNHQAMDIIGIFSHTMEGQEMVHLSSLPFHPENDCIYKTWNKLNGVCDISSICSFHQYKTTLITNLPKDEQLDCQSLLPPQFVYLYPIENHYLLNDSDQDHLCSGKICHINADCIGDNTTHRCQCRQGFQGDGLYCWDIDECIDPSICHSNAVCINTYGAYNCICSDQYIGDGVLECSLPFSCLSTFPDECSCNPGFQKRSIVQNNSNDEPFSDICKDIDECKDGTSSCSHVAHCLNYDGGYLCNCPEGYEGDGIVCVKGKAIVVIRFRLIIPLAESWLITSYLLPNVTEHRIVHTKDVLMMNQSMIHSPLITTTDKGLMSSQLDKHRFLDVIKTGLTRVFDITGERIELLNLVMEQNELHYTLLSNSKPVFIIRYSLRLLPYSPKKQSLHTNTEEMSSYQLAIEIENQLKAPYMVPLKNYNIVGKDFSLLSQKMFVETYSLFPTNDLKEKIVSLWKQMYQHIPEVIKKYIPEELLPPLCCSFILFILICLIHCWCCLYTPRKRHHGPHQMLQPYNERHSRHEPITYIRPYSYDPAHY